MKFLTKLNTAAVEKEKSASNIRLIPTNTSKKFTKTKNKFKQTNASSGETSGRGVFLIYFISL